MTRDFTETAKQKLIAQINEVTATTWWGKVGDFFGDQWLKIQSCFGRLDIQDYLDDVDTYHKKILDMRDTKVEQITSIFNRVQEVDDESFGAFSEAAQEMESKANEIGAISEAMEIPTSMFEVQNLEDVFSGEKTVSELQKIDKLEKAYTSGEKLVDAGDYDKSISYYSSSGKKIGYYVDHNGCTWYALARYNENNPGNELKFSKAGGNAENWVNSVDKTEFDVVETSGLDSSKYKGNLIAVSTEADSSSEFSQNAHDSEYTKYKASGNHVAYVEAIAEQDGNTYVYLTQGAASKSTSQYGYVRKVLWEDFVKDYEYVISAKEE